MRRLLLLLAVISISLAVYAKIRAQENTAFGQQPAASEYEFTIVETLGPANQSTPYPNVSPVTKTYFRRKDGIAGSIIRDTKNGRTANTVEYLNPEQATRTVVFAEGKLKTTYPVYPEKAKLWASLVTVADCSKNYAGWKLTGEAQLFGVTVQKLESDNSTAKVVSYHAPTLGCAMLQERHEWKDKKGAFESWTNDDLVGLRLGPPNPAYFDLDNGAREAPPSEARMAIRAFLFPSERACPNCYVNGNSRADARYYALREEAQKGWSSTAKIEVKPQ